MAGLPAAWAPRRDGRTAFVELSLTEQRYHTAMEVMSGSPVTEVARRYGVSR